MNVAIVSSAQGWVVELIPESAAERRALDLMLSFHDPDELYIGAAHHLSDEWNVTVNHRESGYFTIGPTSEKPVLTVNVFEKSHAAESK